MAIRIRIIKGETVALCAAKTEAKPNDLYLDDAIHHALMVKFTVDLEFEGLLKNPPVDEIVKDLMLANETDDFEACRCMDGDGCDDCEHCEPVVIEYDLDN